MREKNATEIFDHLAQQNKTVSDSMMTRSFEAGDTVCEADEMAASLFLVTGGRVQLYRTTQDGRRFVIATLGPGSMFGEASLLGGEGPTTRAVALEAGAVWVTYNEPDYLARRHGITEMADLIQQMGQAQANFTQAATSP